LSAVIGSRQMAFKAQYGASLQMQQACPLALAQHPDPPLKHHR